MVHGGDVHVAAGGGEGKRREPEAAVLPRIGNSVEEPAGPGEGLDAAVLGVGDVDPALPHQHVHRVVQFARTAPVPAEPAQPAPVRGENLDAGVPRVRHVHRSVGGDAHAHGAVEGRTRRAVDVGAPLRGPGQSPVEGGERALHENRRALAHRLHGEEHDRDQPDGEGQVPGELPPHPAGEQGARHAGQPPRRSRRHRHHQNHPAGSRRTAIPPWAGGRSPAGTPSPTSPARASSSAGSMRKARRKSSFARSFSPSAA